MHACSVIVFLSSTAVAGEITPRSFITILVKNCGACIPRATTAALVTGRPSMEPPVGPAG